MGHNWISGFLEDGTLSRQASMELHLQYNHYPSVSLCMVKPCMDAVENALMDEWDKEVDLPEGMSFKGSKVAPTHKIIEDFHLETFLEYVE